MNCNGGVWMKAILVAWILIAATVSVVAQGASPVVFESRGVREIRKSPDVSWIEAEIDGLDRR
jgi:hypothetical protein